MGMEKVKAIMASAGVGFLATTNGERPAVRPMGAAHWVGGELWLACGADSAKAEDIRQKPNVAFCAADKDWQYVRIQGVCRVSLTKADREEFLKRVPAVKSYFSGPDDPNFAVLRITPGRIRYYAMGAEAGGVEVKPE